MALPRGSNLLRRLSRHWFALAAAVIIAIGVAFRVVLIALGWPHGNAEEGTMGLEAMHILQLGAHPIYYYGQNYLGMGQAYVGAVMFRLAGISTFSLRLGLVVFDTIFLVSLCWLAILLFSRTIALLSVTILVLAWPFLMRCELLADGGKPDIMAASTVMFALATWLALSRPNEKPPGRQRWLRYGAFAAWGLVAGFGLYTYLVVAPFVVASALLLWITCRRELRGWALVFAGVGLIIGFMPTIIYAANLPSSHNPIDVFAHLFIHGSANRNASGWLGWHMMVKQVDATMLYSLPTVTGLAMPYSLQNIPFYGPFTSDTITAVLVGGTWSLAYLSLLAVATYRPFKAIYSTTKWGIARNKTEDVRKLAAADVRVDARDAARLMLAVAAWLTIAAYMASPVSGSNPTTGRYMVALSTALPAVLWPLVEAIQNLWSRREVLYGIWAILILLMLGLSVVNGTVNIFQSVPATIAANQRDIKIAIDLQRHGITRLYSDYWTCDLAAFIDKEHVICSVLTQGKLPPGRSRYTPYDAEVWADPYAPIGFVAVAAADHLHFTEKRLDNYDVYTPVAPLH
jgi:hypothetical protein